jgi:type VI secretion system protein ImpD
MSELEELVARRGVRAVALSMIAEIDRKVTAQVNEVLAHPAFQAVEASWRGLHHLVCLVEDPARVQVEVLSVQLDSLARATEEGETQLSRSFLHRVIFSDRFDQAGADPFSLVMFDLPFCDRIDPDSGFSPSLTLRHLAAVCMSSMAPMVASVDISFFGLDSANDFDRPGRVRAAMQAMEVGDERANWRRFRELEESRFVAMAMPRVLLRMPRPAGACEAAHGSGFSYGGQEWCRSDARCWGGGAIAVVAMMMRRFERTGWFGIDRAADGGVEAIPGACEAQVLELHASDAPPQTEVVVSDEQELQLAKAGFITVHPVLGQHTLTVHALPTLRAVTRGLSEAATADAAVSASLHHVLCACRVMHEVMPRIRSKIGGISGEAELKHLVEQMLQEQRSADPDYPRPLREFAVTVTSGDGDGRYNMRLELVPWVPPESVEAGVQIETIVHK